MSEEIENGNVVTFPGKTHESVHTQLSVGLDKLNSKEEPSVVGAFDALQGKILHDLNSLRYNVGGTMQQIAAVLTLARELGDNETVNNMLIECANPIEELTHTISDLQVTLDALSRAAECPSENAPNS